MKNQMELPEHVIAARVLADQHWAEAGKISRVSGIAEGIRCQRGVEAMIFVPRRKTKKSYGRAWARHQFEAKRERRQEQDAAKLLRQPRPDPGRYWPHEGAQEIARRVRQAIVAEAKRAAADALWGKHIKAWLRNEWTVLSKIGN